MTIRCGCPDQADDLVFGPDHQCSREGRAAVNLQAELDRLERCTCDLPQPPYGHLVCAPHGIDPRERPWETTLGPDDLT